MGWFFLEGGCTFARLYFGTTFASDLTIYVLRISYLIQHVYICLDHKKLKYNLHQQMGAIPPGEMPHQFQVYAETIDGGEKRTYHTDDIPMMPDSDGKVFIQLNTSTPTSPSGSRSLASHRRYKATITAQNIAGGTNSTGDIHFSKSVCVLLISSTALKLTLFLMK